MISRAVFIFVVGLIAWQLSGALAQTSYGQSANLEDRPIAIKTVLVHVPLVASDSKGRSVAGLTKEDFVVRQGTKTQQIQFFASQDGAANIAIVIDSSGSTGAVFGEIAAAARNFLRVIGPEDKGIVVSFDNRVNMLLNDFTSDKGRLKDAINNVATVGGPGSVMNDAIFRLVTKEFLSIEGKKAIIVLTDGDVGGKVPRQRLMESLAASDVVVYPIFFQTRQLLPSDVKSVSFSEFVKLPPVEYLNSIAEATGGRLFVANGSDFSTAFQNIADELKKQYVIGFYPENTESGDVNDIRLEVNRPGVTVRVKRTIRVRTPQNKPD